MADRLQEAKARQVYLVLRDRIMSGAMGFGARLPTENDLALAHAVSRVTVRRALGELQREHLIERRRSAGTRVVYRAPPARMMADISGVLANLADMILRLNRDGLAVLLVEQNVVQSLDIVRRAYVLEHGSFVMSGSAADIRSNADLKRAFLGL